MGKRVLKVGDLSKKNFRVSGESLLLKLGAFVIVSNSGTPIPFNPSLPLDGWVKPDHPQDGAIAFVKFTGHISVYSYSMGNWTFIFSFTHSSSGSISSDIPNYLSLGNDGLPLLSSLGGGGGGSYLLTVSNLIAGNRIASIFDGDAITYNVNETITGWASQGNGVFRYTGESGVTQDIQTNLQLSGDVTTPSAASGVATISANAVTESKIANNAVTVNKIADGSIVESKIGSGAVTNDKLGASAVTAAKILDATITFTKIAQNGATAGQVIQWNGSAWIPVTLALGEVNTASNVGTGAGVYKDKVGSNLRLRSMKAGTNMVITQNADEVLFDSPCPCLSNFFQSAAILIFSAGDCATITKWQKWDSGTSAWVVFSPAGSNATFNTASGPDYTTFILRVEYTTVGGCTLYSNTVTVV